MNWYELEKRNRRSRGKQAAFFRKGDPYAPGQKRPSGRQVNAADVFRIRKRTTLGEIFSAYIKQLAERLQDDMPELKEDEMKLEVRGEEDLGFRFTKHDESGEKIEFFVDCSFNLAPEYVKINIQGARKSQNFSDTLRLFMSDPIMKTSRRLAGRIKRSS